MPLKCPLDSYRQQNGAKFYHPFLENVAELCSSSALPADIFQNFLDS